MAQLKKLDGFVTRRRNFAARCARSARDGGVFHSAGGGRRAAIRAGSGFRSRVRESAVPHATRSRGFWRPQDRDCGYLFWPGTWCGSRRIRVVSTGCWGLRNADFVMNQVFWIGVYPGIRPAMLDYMLEVCKASRRG